MEYLGHTNLLYPFPDFLCLYTSIYLSIYLSINQTVLPLIMLILAHLLSHFKDMKITEALQLYPCMFS